jgi:hypothetical protein
VFVNSRSGGRHGPELKVRLHELITEEQVGVTPWRISLRSCNSACPNFAPPLFLSPSPLHTPNRSFGFAFVGGLVSELASDHS